jgi:hypothetical protein
MKMGWSKREKESQISMELKSVLACCM